MVKKIIIFVLTNFIFIKSYASEEKIPLNNEQQKLVNEYHVCEEYSECRLETLIKLIEITNSKYEYYEPILANFVEHLITVGEKQHWKKYEYLIDEFLLNDTSNTWKVYISSLWGWRLYSVKEIRNYNKALKLLNYSIQTPGNVEMTGNAYYALGVIYEQGRAVKKDFKKSIQYFLEAAKRGDPYAYYRVSLHYIIGNDKIKKNYNSAIKYLKLASTTWVGNSEVSMLRILFDKGRLPNGIKEFEKWVLDDYKKTKNTNNFISLARGFEFVGDYKSAFKYNYIVTKLLDEASGFSSMLEIKNYKGLYIDEEEAKKLIMETDLFLEKLK